MDISEEEILQVFFLKEIYLLIIFKEKFKLYKIDNDNKEYYCFYSNSDYSNVQIYDYININVYWFKINDELFYNYKFELFKIIYDSENKPIKIIFINNKIDKQFRGCPLCVEYTRLIIDDKRFIVFQKHSELCSIIRNENNDIIINKIKRLDVGTCWCSCPYCGDCDKIVRIIGIYNNNDVVLGNDNKIYIYDLQNFQEKKRISFKDANTERYYFIINQQKNELFIFLQFELNIIVYLISLKFLEICTVFNFDEKLNIMYNPYYYYSLMKVYYFKSFRTFILNFGNKILLIYKYDNNNDIKSIKRVNLTPERSVIDLNINNKNKNITLFETTKESINSKKETFHFRKINNFEKIYKRF